MSYIKWVGLNTRKYSSLHDIIAPAICTLHQHDNNKDILGTTSGQNIIALMIDIMAIKQYKYSVSAARPKAEVQ